MTTTRDRLAEAWNLPGWFDYQLEALDGEAATNAVDLRACLYYRTGAGKTYTALALIAQAGETRVTVVAPPRTHEKWKADGAAVGIEVHAISHALYRMPKTKFVRQMPFIIDEFHMLGGQGGKGFDRARRHLRGVLAPVILLSATPNYNDFERVFCVQTILDPHSVKGGYPAWIYQHCETETNPFGALPKIVGALDGRPAKAHLADLPHVYYVEDPHEDFRITDVVLPTTVPGELEEYGLDLRGERIVASLMEYKSVSRKHQLIGEDGLLHPEVYEVFAEIAGQSTTPVLVFCARSTIARAAYVTALQHGAKAGLVVGDQRAGVADGELHLFKQGELDVLFGTATMSTGVDGLDKVCDMLVLLDDTDDDSLRRQVIGRILPRGAATDVSKKIVVRLQLGDS